LATSGDFELAIDNVIRTLGQVAAAGVAMPVELSFDR